jgi:hypothetical protein
MAIKLTDEESIALNKFGYMNINGINDFVKQKLSLQEIAIKLLKNRANAISIGKKIPSFGEWGGITDKEQYEMLEKIAKGKYKNISDLRLQDFRHNPATDFYAYAFHEDRKPENTISIMRGTMGTQTHNNSLLQLADGFTDKYWRDNGYMGLLGVSVHYSEAGEFVERNRGSGQTFCTGFSAGDAYCAYVAATREGITGIGFNGPGIGFTLTEEERNRLNKSGYMSKTCATDPVGSMFFHPERHEYSQCQPVIERDTTGDPVYENGVPKYKEGFFAGHYIQAFATDPKTGMTIAVAQPEQAKRIEMFSQQAYVANKAAGNPLGLVLDGLTVGKGVIAPAMRTLGAVELGQIENGDRKAADEELAKEAVRETKDTLANRVKVSVDSTVLNINQTLDGMKPTLRAIQDADRLEAEVYPQIGEKALEMGQAVQDAKDMERAIYEKAGTGINEKAGGAWNWLTDKAGKIKGKIFGPSDAQTSCQPADGTESAQTEPGGNKSAGLNSNNEIENKAAMASRFREFSAMAPNASLEQRQQAAITSMALDSIFDTHFKNPEINAFMKQGVKDILAKAAQSGDRILPLQKYDPEAEPTRVVRSFTLEELQKQQGQEMGIQKQRSMEYGA